MPNGRGRGKKSRVVRRGRRNNPTHFPSAPIQPPQATIRRNDYMGNFPGGGGDGTFGEIVIPLNPAYFTVSQIASQFSEFRFTRFTAYTSTRDTILRGQCWLGFEYDPPTAATTINQAAQLAGFRAGTYNQKISSRLQLGTMSRPWYRVSDDAGNHNADPTFCQGWLHYGQFNTANGQIGASLHCAFTIQFQGQRFLQPVATSAIDFAEPYELTIEGAFSPDGSFQIEGNTI